MHQHLSTVALVLAMSEQPQIALALDKQSAATHKPEGVQFRCAPGYLDIIKTQMDVYLKETGIAPSLVTEKLERVDGTLTYTLSTPYDDVSTLDLFDRPEYQIHDAQLELPAAHGKTRTVQTASQKEILLALLQHGRLTEFEGGACSVQALKEHVGIRQNIAAFAEVNNFVWPEGGPAKWNKKYWQGGTPKHGVPTHAAMSDMFTNQKAYEIGCYTATKMVVVQGVLDYYRRVKPDPSKAKLIEQRLEADGDPLVNIEPGRVWDFESDFDKTELTRAGKLLRVQYGIAPKNFVPGDWGYMLNTDPITYKKTGYEGSNAIYLGRGKFDDYYNDNEHSYSYRHKLHEVYQWRNHVFSAQRDADKVVPLSTQDFETLGKSPSEGGIVLSLRMTPFFYGYQPLPTIKKTE